MITINRRNTLVRSMAASIGIAALAATVGCGAQNAGTVSAQPLANAAQQVTPAGSPVVVTCEPNQRTLVRPVVVNGATLSQIECVSTNAAIVPAQTFAPAAPAPVEYRTVRAQTVPDDLGDARVVTTERPVTTARAIPARQVVYRDEVARPKRTVAKSAVIIGSTAGAGAGVGALIGGKKGAVIGAVAGAGGATLWDQITRRQK
ncbi:MAG TPA: hypothetical protein VH740_02545 [Vicinamibacterales bacterium]|jgi:hypothetical protein